jgi:UDP-N-acetylglucosamine 4,6-dehydratase/5-epimerase
MGRDMRDIRSILVTGGAGFFGRAFARFLLEHDMVERLCVLSRSEHTQAAMRTELDDDPRLRFFIGCVRDLPRLERAMEGVDLVIHAAALKRIEVGKYDAEEMCRTNIVGTINVVEAARRQSVARIVALSSDKAYMPQPGSAYGQSKALMETIILTANQTSGGHAPITACCRYGNIWNSSGSILPKWLALIKAGAREVPVTSMDATRFLMKVDEAVRLVIATAAHMKGGEIAIPTLPAYRVGDLVEALGVRPKIIGLPAFEKLHESMDAGKSSDAAERVSTAYLREEVFRGTGYRAS